MRIKEFNSAGIFPINQGSDWFHHLKKPLFPSSSFLLHPKFYKETLKKKKKQKAKDQTITVNYCLSRAVSSYSDTEAVCFKDVHSFGSTKYNLS